MNNDLESFEQRLKGLALELPPERLRARIAAGRPSPAAGRAARLAALVSAAVVLLAVALNMQLGDGAAGPAVARSSDTIETRAEGSLRGQVQAFQRRARLAAALRPAPLERLRERFIYTEARNGS
jgi:hypothetical protein